MQNRTLILSILFTFLMLTSISGSNAFSQDTQQISVTVSVIFESSSGEIVVTNPVETDYTVQVFDLTGKEVVRREVKIGNNNVRLTGGHLHRGVYLVRITPAPNAPSVTVKIILR